MKDLEEFQSSFKGVLTGFQGSLKGFQVISRMFHKCFIDNHVKVSMLVNCVSRWFCCQSPTLTPI